ncbi:uncharacterized protein BDR25DRAFT_321690 [Lindgomyces ingoldianus]|uniref:Uncharacterized protein n=1 Tax=Lindgomyces ingoldianus TaxID=673940 RepID=A0ACB6RG42_9PLEO|nr:uncharacterized protein BDR25DRAFT_321690 [Lindgomyces ingoldianus]KAF2477290.1 hypothetical protein BDR25DRAFT_321690 [Lindgomyces ingoldianus]
MLPSSRIPPLLQPYTRLPKDDSIILLTSVLGASANWLIIRFLCDALTTDFKSDNEGGNGADGPEETAVVLVSWVREWEFWKSEGRKGGGLDLERLMMAKRIAFVDGLTGMFLPRVEGEKEMENEVERIPQIAKTAEGLVRRTPQSIVPVRGPPGRTPARDPAAAVVASTTTWNSTSKNQPNTSTTPGFFTLTSPDLKPLSSTISSAIAYLQPPSTTTKKILLILDSPSILLATSPSPSTSTLTSSTLCSTLLTLQTNPPYPASHILVHLNADTPLLSPSSPLEIDEHNLLVKLAHMSTRICSCRVLDTGVARDVSGVLGVTQNRVRGGLVLGMLEGEDEESTKGRELLYLVKGDGSVRVFERGAGEGC